MNSFTNPKPEFPFQSSEARTQLGIPDSPEIHLAITSLAEEMLKIANESAREMRVVRITTLRSASRAALFGWSKAMLECEVRVVADAKLTI